MARRGPHKNGKLKKKNFCTICKTIILGNSYHFKTHLFSHDAIQARFFCDLCPKKFYRRYEFSNHMDKHNGVYSQKKYTCDHCKRTFALKNNLIIHLIRVHDENLDSHLGRFVCNVCDSGYSESRLLFKHIRRVHLNVQFTKKPLHTQKMINETWIESVINKQATVSMTKVNNNIIMIKRMKIDLKPVCESNVVEYTPEHVDQYTKGVCDYCNKEMSKKSLRTHIKEVHMNIRKFKCNTCKQTFARRYQKAEHICGQFRSKKKRRKNVKNNVLKPNKKTVIQEKIIDQTILKSEVKIEPGCKMSIVKTEF